MTSGRIAILLALVAALPFTYNQISAQAIGGAPAAAPPGFKAWSNPELHLTYLYPAELTAIDGAFGTTVARRMIYGDEESDEAKADTCAKVLLSVGKGREGQGEWIRLGLVDVNGQCFPPKALQKKKETVMLLQNMVRQGTTEMGMMPLEQPVGYPIEGRLASFCAAQGEPVSKGDLQTGDQQLIGLVAVQVGGHIVEWVIETNDQVMFNRLLGSGVDFGTGKPERLFPGATQEGPPA
jgi:hypothetical protein